MYGLQWVVPNIHMVINLMGRLLDWAVPVPCHMPGWRPRHSLVPRAGLARAQWPGRGLGHRASGCMDKYTGRYAVGSGEPLGVN
jgi:hypothetical protein